MLSKLADADPKNQQARAASSQARSSTSHGRFGGITSLPGPLGVVVLTFCAATLFATAGEGRCPHG